MKRLALLLAVLPVSAVSTTPAKAGTITLNAVNSGWYDQTGFSNGTTGNLGQHTTFYRDWLGFNLASVVAETITGATLQVASHVANSSGQTVNWWDVTTAYSSLGANSLATYNDLGSGTLFASGLHTAGTINSYTLNAAALSSLNAATGFWAIGGQSTGAGYAFAYTSGVNSGDHLKLVLTTAAASTVPDRALSWVLVVAGLGGIALSRKRLGIRS